MHSKYVTKMSSDSQDHGTPDEIWIPLMNEFNFTVDLCASDKNHLLPKYYTKENSVFNKEINETGYANIEFKTARKFAKYFFDQSRDHDSTIVMLCLVKSNTNWWRDFVMNSAEVRFINDKVYFDGEKNTQGLRWPCAIVVFAPHEGSTKFSIFQQDWSLSKSHKNKKTFYQEWDKIIKTL